MHGYGNALLIVHADGTVAMYAHCYATFVTAGEIVRRGQTIAEVGDTGLAHGAHLHFEWRVRGEVQDPLPHFAERPTRRGSPEPPAPPCSPMLADTADRPAVTEEELPPAEASGG